MFIFPLMTFVFLVLGFYRRYASRLIMREAFLLAAVAWGILLVLSTELLSSFQILALPCLSVFWIAMTVLSMGLCVFTGVDPKADPLSLDLKKRTTALFQNIKLLDGILGSAIVLILFCTGITAWMAAPNNWDSLVYHMARVPHWIQNQTIAHYPTNIKTQIYYPPFAEWVILHFQILSASDRFANLVQWFAFLGSAVAASLVARALGLGGRAQLFAAFFSLTIPMGILQASSTQNDLVLAFWLITFVVFGLRAKNSGKALDAFAMGGALGLALSAKALASILAFPFAIWFLIDVIKNHRQKIIVPIILAGSLVFAMNVNHWVRNVAVCGHILGEEAVFGITRNEKMNPVLFVSNIVRNAALHMGTSIKPLNRLTEKTVAGFHDMIGVGLNEPSISLSEEPLKVQTTTHEDIAGNFIQLFLIITAFVFLLIRRKEFSSPEILKYFLALLGSIVMFNLLLKWQPAGTRLHLPIFVLSAACVAVVLFSWSRRRNWIIIAVIAVLFCTSMPYVIRNSSRKLYSSKRTVFSVPRLRQYFTADETIWPAYQAAVDLIKTQGCQNVGLRTGDNYWEYPFWVLFGQEPRLKVRLEHIDIIGPRPAEYPLGAFEACAILNVGRNLPADEILHYNGKNYVLKLDKGIAKVFLPL